MTDTLAMDFLLAMGELKAASSADVYQPGRRIGIDGKRIPPEQNGQLQFHAAPHIIRLMAPGNGFGKTAAMAKEVDWWATADHPYQDLSRLARRKRQIVWTATKYQQFELLRPKLEPWFTPGWRWVGSPQYVYRWGEMAEMFVITAETDWRNIQGIEPDLVMFDETPPAALWYEMQRRRRGGTETRFCMAATQTDGLTWMYHDVYLPWKRFHEKLGLSEEQAMERQLHRFPADELANVPGIWCWPKGSHRDNPTATAATWAWYLHSTTGSPAERAVRLYGGFRQFALSPVFDPAALEMLREMLRPGVNGAFHAKDDV